MNIGYNFVSQGFEFTKSVLLLFLPIILFPYTFSHAYYAKLIYYSRIMPKLFLAHKVSPIVLKHDRYRNNIFWRHMPKTKFCKSENTLSAATEEGWTSKMSVKALAKVGTSIILTCL